MPTRAPVIPPKTGPHVNATTSVPTCEKSNAIWPIGVGIERVTRAKTFPKALIEATNATCLPVVFASARMRQSRTRYLGFADKGYAETRIYAKSGRDLDLPLLRPRRRGICTSHG